MISSGTLLIPSRSRQSRIAAGVGPLSTTMALPRPVRTASPSPWPTSQATITQSRGGQPGWSGATPKQMIMTAASKSESQGRDRTYAMDSPSSRVQTPTQARVNGVTESRHSAPGSWEPTVAIQMITWALQAAPKPNTAAKAPLTSDAPAAAKPSTVAGPTNGPASAFATSPATLTRSEMATSTGMVAS